MSNLEGKKDHLVIVNPEAEPQSQMKAVSQNLAILWNKISDAEEGVENWEKFMRGFENITMNRIVKYLKEVAKDNIHTSEMPDSSGINGDHDARYYTKTVVNDLLAQMQEFAFIMG